MRPVHCELLCLRIPFHRRFVHARSDRSASDTLLVVLRDAEGRIGMGEVLPRSYVTGEDLTSCLEISGPDLAAAVVGRDFGNDSDLVGWITTQLEECRWGPAILGGFESALLDLQAQNHGLDLEKLIGPRRRTLPGRCVTIGLECPTGDLPKYAKAAWIGRATAVKLKVSTAEDSGRVAALGRGLAPDIALRLDVNGALSFEDVVCLLEETRHVAIQSVEQPLAPEEVDLAGKLVELRRRCGASLMADESVCTIHDARHWVETGGYQWFNVRVGKSGGLLAATAIARLAQAHGIGVVCGTMVGETEVLDRASALLLARSESLPYVEGIGQYRFLLSVRPVRRVPLGPETSTFVLEQEVVAQCLVTRRTIGD